MREFTYLMFIILSLSSMGFAQNRIHGWDIDKITSMEIDITNPAGETTNQIFNAQQEIDLVITFLKNVEFREMDSVSTDHETTNDLWKCKIVFQGQRDQVYLFNNKAFIGKTSFGIDENVIEDFRMLVQKLRSGVK